MKGLVALLAALLALGFMFFFYASPTSEPAEMTEADIAQIEAEAKQAITDQWARYGNLESRTFEDWAALNAPDFWILEPGLDIRGDEVAQLGRDFFGSGAQVLSYDVESLEIFVHDDAAYQIGRYSEVLQNAEGVATDVHKNFFARWKKQPDGEWRLDRWLGGQVESPSEG